MKRILFKNIMLLLFAAGLALSVPEAAWASSQPEKAPTKEAKSGSSDDEVSGGKFDGDPVMIHVKPVHITVIDDYGADQIVSLSIVIQVKDSDAAKAFLNRMPRVQDAILQAIYGGMGSGDLKMGNAINLPKAKKYIAYYLKKNVNGAQVDDILIESLAQRRL